MAIVKLKRPFVAPNRKKYAPDNDGIVEIPDEFIGSLPSSALVKEGDGFRKVSSGMRSLTLDEILEKQARILHTKPTADEAKPVGRQKSKKADENKKS